MYGYLLFVHKGAFQGKVVGGYQQLGHAKNGAVHRGLVEAGDWTQAGDRWVRGECTIVRVYLTGTEGAL